MEQHVVALLLVQPPERADGESGRARERLDGDVRNAVVDHPERSGRKADEVLELACGALSTVTRAETRLETILVSRCVLVLGGGIGRCTNATGRARRVSSAVPSAYWQYQGLERFAWNTSARSVCSARR